MYTDVEMLEFEWGIWWNSFLWLDYDWWNVFLDIAVQVI